MWRDSEKGRNLSSLSVLTLCSCQRSRVVRLLQRNVLCLGACVGGADRDRTDDIQLAKLALSQLSYGPVVSLRSSLPEHLRVQERGGPGKI
jgi:hypothetical protein